MAENANGKTRKRRTHTSPKEEKPSAPADEYTTFSNALKKVLTVSHGEMQKRISRASAVRKS